MRPSYMTAVLGLPPPAHPLAGLDVGELEQLAELAGLELEELAAMTPDEVEGLFDALGKAVKSVTKTVSDAASVVDRAYVAATPQWLRKGAGTVVGTVFAPQKFALDAATGIASGQRVDRALLAAAESTAKTLRDVAPLVQLGLSTIPGVGQGASAVLGAAFALAEGKPITDALISAVKGAIPGGPLAQRAIDMGARAAVDLAQGKRIDTVALDALRRQLPGGEAARIAFDTGLALAQGKKIQEAGLAAASRLMPSHPLAQGAFALTKQLMAGGSLPGVPAARAPARPQMRRAAGARLVPLRTRSTAVRTNYDAGGSTSDWGEEPTPPAPDAPPPAEVRSGMALPIALGAVALAAAGGGVWWLAKNRRTNQ